jgi:potassium efflux system protein
MGGSLLRSLGAMLIAGISLDRSISFIPALRPFQRAFYARLGQVVDTALGVLIQPLPNSNVSIASLLVFFVLATLVFTVAHYISVGLKQRFWVALGWTWAPRSRRRPSSNTSSPYLGSC